MIYFASTKWVFGVPISLIRPDELIFHHLSLVRIVLSVHYIESVTFLLKLVLNYTTVQEQTRVNTTLLKYLKYSNRQD